MNARQHSGEAAPAAVSDSGTFLILNQRLDEISAWCLKHGYPAYRARQLWRWLYVNFAADWDAMRNLPAELRRCLAGEFRLKAAAPCRVEGSAGKTRKLLLELRDGERIETVLIPAGPRRTVCVSSQAGCRFHCAFCASGQAGFRRNLESGEMVGQVLAMTRAGGGAPTHVVFMGIGEPMDNYDAVFKAVRIINDESGLAVGARRITVSTCGIIPGIERMVEEEMQIELSVSLHATHDALRSELMPVNRLYPLVGLMAACRDYTEQTGRIITFEYALIGGVNDGPAQAKELARLLADMPCRVNLIPLSPVSEFGGQPSAPGVAEMFIRRLKDAGINATFRRSRGLELKAACGQLRYSHA